MVIFCHCKRIQGCDIGFYLFTDSFLQSSLGIHCHPVLRFGVKKDGILVLLGHGLPGRLVAVPENIQKLAVCDAPWIVINLYGFCVIPHISVAWCIFTSTGIPHPCTNDTFNDPEPGFNPPESPQTK